MQTRFIEVTNGFNFGKFMLGRFEQHEWARASSLEPTFVFGLVDLCGWTHAHLLVLDLETCEGAVFKPGGLPSADLDKHRIWVCPMFEPFLEWLYLQELSDLDALPGVVHLPDAPSALYGYRRGGPR